MKTGKFKEAVEALEASLHEAKNDSVKDMLIDAKQKFKEWDIEQNKNPELSDQCNKEANQFYKDKN
jgi:stress-induced-phosphoprotein 1